MKTFTWIGKFVFLACVAAPFCAPAAGSFTEIKDNRGDYPEGKIPAYAKFEVSFKLTGEYGNPFAPYPVNPAAPEAELVDADGAQAALEGVTATGVFAKKDSPAIHIPAFWDGDGLWRLRMTPTEPGEWSYAIEISDGKGDARAEPGVFQVVSSKAPGFVRVKTGGRFFQFDNGAAFLPLGNNLVKTTDRKVIEGWGKSLREHGMNSQRFWLHPHYTAIEWNASGPDGPSYVPDAPGLGRYNLSTAWNMDFIVETAERNGLYGILCQDDTICYTNSPHGDPHIGWEYNPYRPLCKDGIEFFINAHAKRFYKRRLRYMVARWGYSSHVLAWELQNEADWPYLEVVRPDQGALWKLTDLVAWHEEMADYLRTLDPYRRPVAANTASGCPGWGQAYRADPATYDDRLFLLHGKMDFSNHHVYGADIGRVVKTAAAFAKNVPGKPLLLGEWGLDAVYKKGEANITAPIGLHNAIWTGLMTTGGAPYHWHWDKYREIGGLAHYGAAAEFLKDENPAREGWVPAVLQAKAEGVPLESYGLVGSSGGVLWVWDPRSAQDKPVPGKIGGASVAIEGASPGSYRADYFDAWAGEWLESRMLEHAGGTLTLPLPEFSRDVAVKISPKK